MLVSSFTSKKPKVGNYGERREKFFVYRPPTLPRKITERRNIFLLVNSLATPVPDRFCKLFTPKLISSGNKRVRETTKGFREGVRDRRYRCAVLPEREDHVTVECFLVPHSSTRGDSAGFGLRLSTSNSSLRSVRNFLYSFSTISERSG